MKFTLLLLASLFFALLSPLTPLQAQDNDSTAVHIIPEDSKAVQFGVSGLVRLTSFSGATFSYKKQITNKRAKRISFRTNNLYLNTNYPESEGEQNESRLDVEFGLEYTWMNYLNPTSEIKFYYGLGPGVDFAYDFTKNEDFISTREQKQKRFGLSGIGYFGFEWFFKPQMSLHAEYRAVLKVEYTSEMNKIDDDRFNQKNERNSTGIQLSGEPVLFGLSIYF